jgi:hypothetical protein
LTDFLVLYISPLRAGAYLGFIRPEFIQYVCIYVCGVEGESIWKRRKISNNISDRNAFIYKINQNEL